MDLRMPLGFQFKKAPSTNTKEVNEGERTFAVVVDYSILAPECILPVQYFAGGQRGYTVGPEGRLMLAVLEDAISCYLRTMNRAGRRALLDFHEVNAWFSSTGCRNLFAFENICEVLDINPGWLRRSLNSLRIAAKRRHSVHHNRLPGHPNRSLSAWKQIVNPKSE
jgi:hypothetical protein